MSDFKRPKFAYNPGSGLVDFSPARPAVQKVPVTVPQLDAVRHDSVSSDGTVIQFVLERIDEVVELPFQDVPESDLSSWKAFFTYALTGGQFTYYPDATDTATYYDFTLMDTNWRPRWKSWKNYSFTMSMRKYEGSPTYYS